jgi:hypothetical protein
MSSDVELDLPGATRAGPEHPSPAGFAGARPGGAARRPRMLAELPEIAPTRAAAPARPEIDRAHPMSRLASSIARAPRER